MEASNTLQESAMSNADIERIEELFQAAADLQPAEREAFLDRKCHGDQDLRTHVQRLVDRLDDETSLGIAGGATQGRPIFPFPGAAVAEGPGAVIDKYKLLQVIGEGGFGVVYMAEQQEPVVRKVALKIIKLGMDTREVVARFEAERQALAMMDHSDIAKVLDGGATNSGRPYFVMELVRGVSITEFCDKNDLGTRQRLELFLRVCHAVQHAHQKGVIHRDLKPSNVMVTLHDGNPIPKVIDFGVAKAGACAPYGSSHCLPVMEKFDRDTGIHVPRTGCRCQPVGHRYAERISIRLGAVLLYELLAGASTPFDARTTLKQPAGLDETLRMIREEAADQDHPYEAPFSR